ncbi:Calcium-activated chloride channel regulator 1 [Holothuria leucospilota]|uniref:Calcium-activated chloride channel regulator 1 n=1 Tax=Holothuria leucospilota TaxID=206669 RepID=A0A9Q1H320_HOLLE|nr:Calcium-activated chloride channel regulator 1 [Holothuria leucospilota]
MNVEKFTWIFSWSLRKMTGYTTTFGHVYALFLILLIHLHRTGSQIAYQEPFYKGATEAKLSDGGYEGVVVAISPQVPEDEQLITRITEVFTDFSNYLYEVSRKRTYLKEVRILIPTTWADDSSYESAVSERFEESDIRIDYPQEEGNLPNRNLPYTNNPTFCGSQGFYIHLTPEYLENINTALLYGSYKKVLAHEWAHYRWGVFDEYPRPLSDDPHFYQASSGSIEGVRCTTTITGQQRTPDGDPCIIPADGIPEDNCRFVDDRKSTQKTASLMYKQFLDQITEYCDDEERVSGKVRVRHNAEAPNHHNIQCAGRSVWQVMGEHSDFSTTSTSVVNRPTQFVKVRQRPSRYVLVIDTSASMTYRLHVLRQACYIFIHQVLLDGESLAIVEFNDVASTRSNLTVVDPSNRQSLVQKLPTSALGSTTIGAGVLEALNVLNRTSDLDELGGRLIVLTDGQETREPHIKDIINQTDSVLIHTIAIGDDVAEDLETLANRAGGKQFLHQDASTALFDIFSQFGVESRGANSEELVSSYLPKIPPGTTKTITFVRDNTLRGGIVIYIGVLSSATNLHFGGERVLDVRLMSPSKVDMTNSKYDSLVSMFILNTISSEEGEWNLTLRNLDSINLNISILVLAETKERQISLPITSTGLWAAADINPPQVQTAYLTLGRGYNPVIDPEVNAVVETPMGVQRIKLFDDGIGEDITKGDGVYSGFFTRFTAPGRYNVQFSVLGAGRIVKGARIGIGAAVDPDKGDSEWDVLYEDAGDVQRTITGGSFTCNNQRTCQAVNNYGPYRITNLRAKNINRDNRTFDLVFCAPGADLMDGTASRYDIRFSTHFDSFLKQFTSGEPVGMVENSIRPYILQGNLNQPLEARSEENFTIVLPASEDQIVYFFALTAVDEESLESPMSNIVSVSAKGGTFPSPLPPIAPTTPSARVIATEQPDDSFLLPIVGAALLLLLLLLLILLLLLLLLRQKKKEKEQDNKEFAIKQEENILGSGIVNGSTIRESDDRYNAEQGEDVTRSSALLTNDRHSHAHLQGQGDLGNDPYHDAHTTGSGRYPPNGHPTALLAGQHSRGMDSRRAAERFSYPNGGIDHSAHSNIRAGVDSDALRQAERATNYNFLPGNAHSFNGPQVQQAGIVNSPGGDYTFLPVDTQQADMLRQATFVQNPDDYTFLPAEATDYGALRVANIEYNAGEHNTGDEGRVKSLANNLGSVLFQGGGNPRV